MNEIEKLEKQIEELKKKEELKTREEKEALDKKKKVEKKKKQKEADEKDKSPPELPERDESGKFKRKDGDNPEDLKAIAEAVKDMAKEIQELKKGGITRKKPSKAVKTKEEDLPEEVTIKIQKNMFEVDV